MGVAVVAGAVFPFSVEDVSVAFMECKFAACRRQKVIVELNICLGLRVYCVQFGDGGEWVGFECLEGVCG